MILWLWHLNFFVSAIFEHYLSWGCVFLSNMNNWVWSRVAVGQTIFGSNKSNFVALLFLLFSWFGHEIFPGFEIFLEFDMFLGFEIFLGFDISNPRKIYFPWIWDFLWVSALAGMRSQWTPGAQAPIKAAWDGKVLSLSLSLSLSLI